MHHKKERSSSGDSLENEKRRDKPKVELYRCHQFGNYRSECHTILNRNCGNRSNFIKTKEDRETKEEEEESLLLTAYTSNE